MKKKAAAKIPIILKNEVRRFALFRKEDESGTSGCGLVASGVVFSSGMCVLHWETLTKSIGIYHSVSDLEAIHGHSGKTIVQWID